MDRFVYDKMKVGMRAQNKRIELRYTQEQLAEMIDRSVRLVADVERGAVGMSVETLLAMCDALEITPNDLLLENTDYSDSEQIWLINALSSSAPEVRRTAIELMRVYLRSVQSEEKPADR